MTLLVTPSARRDDLGMQRAARQLGVPYALVLGHLALLEAWAADHRPTGQGLTAEDVEEAARWEGEAGWLARALTTAGAIVELDGALALAGWGERQAALTTGRLTTDEREDLDYVRGRRARDRVRKVSARVRGTSADASADTSPPSPSPAASASSPLSLSPTPPLTLSSSPPPPPPPAPPTPPREAVVAIVEAWNRGREGSGVAAAAAPGRGTAKRDAALAREAQRFPGPIDWEWCARALADSPGHNGTSDGGFVADLPWLLARGSGLKLEQWIERGRQLHAAPAHVGPDDTLAAWVAAWSMGLDTALGATLEEPPSARTADRDRQLADRLRAWATAPSTAGWCEPAAATGGARAMTARARRAQRAPVTLGAVLGRRGWLEDLLAGGDSYRPRAPSAPAAPAAPAPPPPPRPQRDDSPEATLARLREIVAAGMGGEDHRRRIADLERDLGVDRGETVVVSDPPEAVEDVVQRVTGRLTAPGRRSAYRARARASPAALMLWPTHPTIEA